MSSDLSVIVPCYNEEKVLSFFFEKLSEVLNTLDLENEVIFIDDGSLDATLSVIKNLQKEHKNVKWVSFSRNFGKEAAILAGMRAAKGDYIAVMDADLQDPPELLRDMADSVLNKGYDSAAVYRSDRQGERFFRSLFSKMFYWLFNLISSVKIVPGARDYRLMTRQMTNAVLSLSEYNRFTKGIYSWVGFKTRWIEMANTQRAAGDTKWSFLSLVFYSLEAICSFSNVPLTVASYLGIFLCLGSFLGIIAVIAQKLFWDAAAYGWSSMICILSFLSGLQLFCLGIVGRYLAKIYLETKQRPAYIVKAKSDGTDLL